MTHHISHGDADDVSQGAGHFAVDGRASRYG